MATTLTNSSGATIERFEYDPYGKRAVLNADWTPDGDGASDVAFAHGHQGLKYDEAAGLYDSRLRPYDPELGRFTSPDPVGYLDGMSQYQGYGSSPGNFVDPAGLFSGLPENDPIGGIAPPPGGWGDGGITPLPAGVGMPGEAVLILFGDEKEHASRRLKKRPVQAVSESIPLPPGYVPPQPTGPGWFGDLLDGWGDTFYYALGGGGAGAAGEVWLGAGEGALQGAANAVNGLQHAVIGTVNMAPVLRLTGYEIPSPDWSKGLVFDEDPLAHNVSVFLGGEGLLTVLTAGLSLIGNARHIGHLGAVDDIARVGTAAQRRVPLNVLQKCFVAGTQVLVGYDEHGKPVSKAIEDIDEGDYVLARDQGDFGDDVDARRVVRVFRKVSDHIRIVTYADASGNIETLRTTDEHPFWVEGLGWLSAAALRAGMRLGDLDGPGGVELMVLTSTREEHPQGIAVYNFEVEGDHTYFVEDGVGEQLWAWVHNECVYRGIDAAGRTYIGITNNIVRRAAEHLRKTGLRIREIPGLGDLERAIARGVEQILIDRAGLGNLLNRINAISRRNPAYDDIIREAQKVLDKLGI